MSLYPLLVCNFILKWKYWYLCWPLFQSSWLITCPYCFSNIVVSPFIWSPWANDLCDCETLLLQLGICFQTLPFGPVLITESLALLKHPSSVLALLLYRPTSETSPCLVDKACHFPERWALLGYQLQETFFLYNDLVTFQITQINPIYFKVDFSFY